jgi:hypothetical protein
MTRIADLMADPDANPTRPASAHGRALQDRGLLSRQAAKRNAAVAPIGRMHTGETIYRFRRLGERRFQIGTIEE